MGRLACENGELRVNAMVDLSTRTSLLLGAGASREAGMPLASEFTDLLVDYFDQRDAFDFDESTARALRAVRDRLQGDSGPGSVQVEMLFSAIRLMSRRYSELEISPLVEKWAEDVISADISGGTSGLPALTRVEHGMTDALSAILRPRSELLLYNAPLFNLPTPVRVATLNYDLTIEESARLAGCSVDTGASAWRSDGRGWRWIQESEVRVLKLHGSLTWFPASPGDDPELPLARGIHVVEDLVADPSHPAAGQTLLVFGQRDKLRPVGPFQDLLVEWRKWLSATDHLIVVGYSFSDSHINECLRGWLSGGIGRQMWVIDPSLASLDLKKDLKGFLAEAFKVVGDRRIHLCALNAGEGLAQLLGDGVGWAPPETDRWGFQI